MIGRTWRIIGIEFDHCQRNDRYVAGPPDVWRPGLAFPQWTCAHDHARLWLYEAGLQTTMKNCPSCDQELPDISRFCTQCGHPVAAPASASPSASTPRVKREDLNINVLYA
ncbi:MAG: zinc-ribbon domain-containing protein, partial [Nitrospiraceae bacterium]